jgi:hypothetical protein
VYIYPRVSGIHLGFGYPFGFRVSAGLVLVIDFHLNRFSVRVRVSVLGARRLHPIRTRPVAILRDNRGRRGVRRLRRIRVGGSAQWHGREGVGRVKRAAQARRMERARAEHADPMAYHYRLGKDQISQNWLPPSRRPFGSVGSRTLEAWSRCKYASRDRCSVSSDAIVTSLPPSPNSQPRLYLVISPLFYGLYPVRCHQGLRDETIHLPVVLYCPDGANNICTFNWFCISLGFD